MLSSWRLRLTLDHLNQAQAVSPSRMRDAALWMSGRLEAQRGYNRSWGVAPARYLCPWPSSTTRATMRGRYHHPPLADEDRLREGKWPTGGSHSQERTELGCQPLQSTSEPAALLHTNPHVEFPFPPMKRVLEWGLPSRSCLWESSAGEAGQWWRLEMCSKAQPREEGGHSPSTNLVNTVVCVPRSSWALRGVPSPLWMPISSSEKHMALYHSHFPSSPDGRWFYLSSGAWLVLYRPKAIVEFLSSHSKEINITKSWNLLTEPTILQGNSLHSLFANWAPRQLTLLRTEVTNSGPSTKPSGHLWL